MPDPRCRTYPSRGGVLKTKVDTFGSLYVQGVNYPPGLPVIATAGSFAPVVTLPPGDRGFRLLQRRGWESLRLLPGFCLGIVPNPIGDDSFHGLLTSWIRVFSNSTGTRPVSSLILCIVCSVRYRNTQGQRTTRRAPQLRPRSEVFWGLPTDRDNPTADRTGGLTCIGADLVAVGGSADLVQQIDDLAAPAHEVAGS